MTRNFSWHFYRTRKDPDAFDFISVGKEARQREVEAALVTHNAQGLMLL